MRALATRSGLLAAVTFFIVLLSIPTQARAHPGHNHGPASVSSTIVVEDTEVALAVAAPAVEVYAYSQNGGLDGAARCIGGCCTSTSHACCAFIQASRPDADGPAFVHERVDGMARFALLDHRPTMRGKPPRIFA
jgi:hypothetical protein